MREYERMKLRAECNTDNPEHSPRAAAAASALTQGIPAITLRLQNRPDIHLQVLLMACPYQIQCNKQIDTIDTIRFLTQCYRNGNKWLVRNFYMPYCIHICSRWAPGSSAVTEHITVSESMFKRNNSGLVQPVSLYLVHISH